MWRSVICAISIAHLELKPTVFPRPERLPYYGYTGFRGARQRVVVAGERYVTAGAPVLGSEMHTSRHGGATYWFASAENQAAFEAEPDRYAPRYGGYCAYAASQNRLSPVDPASWSILDGQLVLFTNPEFHRLFDEDPPGHKAKADGFWPGLVARHGKPQQ